jgi:hypothetical protein
MPFSVNNGPPTFQGTINKAFREYSDQFMMIFLDDFTIYNDLESHLMKLKIFFPKCKKYKISFNIDKCAFMVFSRLILGFIISKEGKSLNPVKVRQ